MTNFVNWIKKPVVWITALIVCVIGGTVAVILGRK